MPAISLPTPGVTPTPVWAPQLNAAITAINDEMETGRLSSTMLASQFEAKLGTRGVTRTIYVRATGSDTTGDGTTEATAFREIRYAVDKLSEYGPVVRGTISINVGAGTYKGGIQLPNVRYRAQDDFIRIVGPGPGHPSVPTVIISYAADTTATFGIQANNGTTLWLENLKFTGAFPVAVDIRYNCVLQSRNNHIDAAVTGFSFLSQCQYDMRGGIIENCTAEGIREHFGIVRGFSNVSSRAEGTVIRNCFNGVLAKEDCSGHLDWITFDNNRVAVELQAWTVANLRGAMFTRNTVGILTVNSEVHNTGGIVWGTGVNANTRRRLALGNSDEINSWGWGDGSNYATINTGHRPLKQVASTYTNNTITGSTSETTAYASPTVIPAGRLSVSGCHVKVKTWWSVNTPPTTTSRVLLRLGGGLTAQAVIPSTAVAGQDFAVDFDVVCPADGNSQNTMAVINGFAAGTSAYAETTHNLSDADFSAAVSVLHAEAGSSVTLRLAEVWA